MRTARRHLTANDADDFADYAEKDAVCLLSREPLCPLYLTFVVLSLTMLMSCQTAPSRQPALPEPVSAGALTKEYQESTTDARRKYDGREVTVSGYTAEAAIIPPRGDDQGLVLLDEKDRKAVQQVACWFSRDQAEQFSTIKGGQFISVKGIFNGEAGIDLRFCKLVKIENESN